MSVLESLLRRNGDFVRSAFDPTLKMMPTGKMLIVGCVDPRVDPAKIFELSQAEAAVFRNVGGRVTPSLLETLALLREVTIAATGNPSPLVNLVLFQHTDCCINHCYHRAPDLLARHMGIAREELDARAVTDPYKAVALDAAALRADARFSSGYSVSGLVYDVATGKVEIVVPPEAPKSA